MFIGSVVTLAGWEWSRLAGLKSFRLQLSYAFFVSIILFFLWCLPQVAPVIMLIGLLWWCMALFLVCRYPSSFVLFKNTINKLWIGLLILIPAWQGLIFLKLSDSPNSLILAVLSLVWIADIGAYFTGKSFGKTKLAPAISPGKSREGVLGGLLLCFLTELAVGIWYEWSLKKLIIATVIVVVVVMASILGDLVESMF
ncbi:UNVERIFIED_CONTAM: hypothetical protein GTU68_010911, partial [Idotea baltica]|nr:hypothetical protein [Idotea baltica]